MAKSKTVHLFMQGKGGVGKTTMAVMFAQYRLMLARKIDCYDIDPVNSSLSEFSALQVRKFDLIANDEIDSGKFDHLMESILSSNEDALVDTGSSVFVPLSAYLIENHAFVQFLEGGKNVIVHVVLAGDQALTQTLSGFESIVTHYHPDVRVIVWLNEFFGPIEVAGLQFDELEVFRANRDRVLGIVRVPRKSEKTFVKDMRQMLSQKMTFEEAIRSPEIFLMSRQRLKLYRDLIFNQLQEIEV